jgi:hypothetical protein
VGLEQGLLRLVKVIEEVPERKVVALVYKSHINSRGGT